jgi:hypothetical protein
MASMIGLPSDHVLPDDPELLPIIQVTAFGKMRQSMLVCGADFVFYIGLARTVYIHRI